MHFGPVFEAWFVRMDTMIQWIRHGACLGLACLVFLSQGAQAQAWRAQRLVDEALAANSGIDALQASVTAARWQVTPAGALDDPQLSYAIAPYSVGVGGLDTGHIIGLAQPIPWPGKRATRQARATASVELAASELRQLQLELAAMARQAHAQLRYLHAAIQTNEEQRQRLADLQVAATGRYRAGAGSQHAVLSASTRLAERQRQSLELHARRQALEARINALRNRPMDAPVPRPAQWQALAGLPPADQLAGAVQHANPQLSMLRARIRAARLDHQLADLEDKPDLRLTANYLGTLPREEYRTQVGVVLNLPFGQSKRDAAQSAAAAQVVSLSAQHADIQRRLEADLAEQVAGDRAAAAMQRLYANELLPLARQTLDAALADYASGRGDVGAVIDAEERLLQARLGLLESQARQWTHRAVIARLTGGALDGQLLREIAS